MKLFGWWDDNNDEDRRGGSVRRKDTITRRMRRRIRRRRRRQRRAEQNRNRPSSGGGSFPDFAQELLALHSNARPKNYRLNADLCQSAQGRAAKMDAENRMYHESDWWRRIERAGYDQRTCGENLGDGFSEPESVFRAWMNSPMHRKNIMNGEFTEIGFGKSGEYWVAHFGDR